MKLLSINEIINIVHMTPQEFNQLPSNVRAELLWDQGQYLLERVVYNEYIVKMYLVDKFYVEVYYNANDNQIEDVTALENEKDWEGFLNSINIKVLLNQ